MIPKKTHLWIFGTSLFLLLLFACQPIAPEQEIKPTSTEIQTEVPQPSLTVTPTSTPIHPTFAPTHIPSPTPITDKPVSASGLIFAGNSYNPKSMILLGGYTEGNWLIPEEASSYFNILDALNYYSLDNQGSEIITDFRKDISPVTQCTHEAFWLSLASDSPLSSIGLSGFTPLPSSAKAENLSPENETYRQFLKEYLIEHGNPNPTIQIERILRVDLENDGVDEVLIEASYFANDTGHSISPGSYSLILLRKISENSVETQLVVGEIYNAEGEAYPYRYFLEALLDINRDGKTEVFVGITRWEGSGAILYELEDNTLKEVLRMFCHL